jgi:hypothetical protein
MAQHHGRCHTSVSSGARTYRRQPIVIQFTEANVKAVFDHAQKLIQAKDPQEILAHQAEYVKKQLAAAEEHAKELGRQ